MRKNALMAAVGLGLVIAVAVGVIFASGSYASIPDKYEGITGKQKVIVKAYRDLCDSEKELRALNVDCEARELADIAGFREANTR